MISTTDMQALKNVSAFFNFLNDPEKFKVLIKEAQVAIADMQETTKLFVSIEAFEKFQAEAKLKLAQANEKLEKDKQTFKENSDKLSQSLNTRAASLADKEKAYDLKTAKLLTDVAAVNMKLKDLEDEYEKLHLKKEETNERAIALVTKEKEVEEKLTKLNAALEVM